MKLEETLRAFDDVVRSGKVRYVGVSNVTGAQLQRIVDLNQFMGFNQAVVLQVWSLNHYQAVVLQVWSLNQAVVLQVWSLNHNQAVVLQVYKYRDNRGKNMIKS